MTKQPVTQAPLTRAIVVAADVSRWGEPMTTSAEHVWTKVSQKDTAGEWSMFESLVPAGFGVPFHRHHSQEEWFWILEGRFIFDVGGEIHRLDPGIESARSPANPASLEKDRRIERSNVGDGSTVKRHGELLRPVRAPFPDQLRDVAFINGLFVECDMEVVGPPLDDAVC